MDYNHGIPLREEMKEMEIEEKMICNKEPLIAKTRFIKTKS